jgi:predicted RNA-binding Zn-ribbon protein involved in translation (DUF1610 family)
MAAPPGTNFNCPQCGRQYTIVRVEARAVTDKEAECVNCGAPFEARDGRFALKYFLVGPTAGRNRRR